MLKDEVGRENINIPMLDVKQEGGGLAYCDIIIYTDNVTAWDQAIRKYYKDWSLSDKIISGGHQMNFVSVILKTPLYMYL